MPIIGGIQYSPAVQPVPTGAAADRLDGVCCQDCLTTMLAECRSGVAYVETETEENQQRFEILRRLVDMRAGIPRQYLLTGKKRTEALALYRANSGLWTGNALMGALAALLFGEPRSSFDSHLIRFDSDNRGAFASPRREELFQYNEDPFSHFEWDDRNKQNALVFGVELEMEPPDCSTSGQQGIISALGGVVGNQYILKSDGSLCSGVELVTMPFTLSQHLDGSGVPWDKMLPKLYPIATSGAQTDSCGIHIHINKRALSALTIGKMLVFLNDSGLSPLVTQIAQRPSGSFCRRGAKKLTDGTRSSENRYDIMNVSVRHPTCELRMFKGNLTLERVYKNIEFCHALVQYCRQSSMRTLTEWGHFSQWLIRNRGQYQNLVRFLVDHKTVGFRQLARDSRDGQTTIIDR
jgi:hypothetical protein